MSFEHITRERTAWLAEQHQERQRAGTGVQVWFARVLLDDDQRVANGEASSIPTGAKDFVEAHRMTAAKLAEVTRPGRLGEALASAQASRTARAEALKRWQATGSDPEAVALLLRVLERERQAEAADAEMKVSL